WLDDGRGSSEQAALASSNSWWSIQPSRSTASLRSRAMWAGGPPKPVTPIRVHSRATVASGASPGVEGPCSVGSVIAHLVGELAQGFARLAQDLAALGGDLVDASRVALLDHRAGAQQAFALQPVE